MIHKANGKIKAPNRLLRTRKSAASLHHIITRFSLAESGQGSLRRRLGSMSTYHHRIVMNPPLIAVTLYIVLTTNALLKKQARPTTTTTRFRPALTLLMH